MPVVKSDLPTPLERYAPHRPIVTKEFVDADNRHDFVAWINALKEIYARLEQTECRAAGHWRKSDWEKIGHQIQQVRYMENECRKFALKRNQYGAPVKPEAVQA